jgi:CxxC motif-containing protein
MSEFTCIICPWGCSLKAEGEDISGYSCLRGMKYAREEQTDPKRAISGSVRLCGAALRVLPVKTSAPIPKRLVREAAALLGGASAHPPIKTGDVVIPDILGTGVDFIAARSVESGA